MPDRSTGRALFNRVDIDWRRLQRLIFKGLLSNGLSSSNVVEGYVRKWPMAQRLELIDSLELYKNFSKSLKLA